MHNGCSDCTGIVRIQFYMYYHKSMHFYLGVLRYDPANLSF